MDEIDPQVQELENQKAQLVSDVRGYEGALGTLKLNKESAESDLNALLKRKKEVETELAGLENSLNKKTKMHDDATKLIDKKMLEWREEVDSKTIVLQKLNEDIAEARTVLEGLNKNIQDCNTDLAKCQEMFNEFLKNSETQKDTLETELASLQERVTGLTAELDSKYTDKVKVNKDLEKAQADLAKMIEQIEAEKESQGENQKSVNKAIGLKNEKLAQVSDKLATKVAEHKKESARLDSILEQKRAENEKLDKRALGVVSKEEELTQREAFLKQRYQNAGVEW